MQKAFSLVELSIVLVILGLLTGGILAGQNLIRAAELRSVTAEFQSYQTAAQTFRDKYFALPGDMRNAQDFWGVANASPSTCITTASTSALTCNGDGDGRIEYATTGSNEMYRYWQHLANAGLIEGSYSGIAGAGDANESLIGVNVPRSKLGNGGWSMYYIGDMVSNTLFFDGSYGNTYYFGAERVADPTDNPIMTAEEMWNLDTKMDDSLVASGAFRGYTNAVGGGNCANASGVYNLTSSVVACNLLILSGL